MKKQETGQKITRPAPQQGEEKAPPVHEDTTGPLTEEQPGLRAGAPAADREQPEDRSGAGA